MRKFFLRKRRFYMALIAAIDVLRNRIVRDSLNVGMTVAAFDTAVDTMIIQKFINIIIPALAVLIDSSAVAVFVAHEAIIFISRPGR